MFTYQYCAIYHSNGDVAYIDGIATLNERIKTGDDYKELKSKIDKDNYHKLVITNLSLI